MLNVPSSQPEDTMPPKKTGPRYDLTDEQKRKFVERYEATPQGEGEAFCKKHGISSPLIAYWRKTLAAPESVPAESKFHPDSTPKKPVFTEEYKRRIAEEVRQGASKTTISKREQISRSAVTKWAARAGQPPVPPPGYSPEKRAAVMADLVRMPAEAAAAKHGVHFTTVYEWKRKAAGKPAKPRRNRTAVVVEATQRALEKVNNGTPPSTVLAMPTDHRSAGQFIREALRRLRGVGVDIASITVDGDHVTIRYNSQETIEL